MKRFITMVIVVTLLAMMVMSVAAEETTVVMPRYSYVDAINSRLSINEATGLASCNVNSTFHGGASQKLTCELQRYNGSGWVTVKTWSTTSTMSANIAKQYAVYSGYTYRVHAICRVYNSSGTIMESVYCDSNQVAY